MRVLVVYAHHDPNSFTHGLFEQVTKGLEDGGHAVKVNDLNTTGFDPVFRPEDGAQFAHESVPRELLERMDPGQARDGRRAGAPLDGEALAPRQGRLRIVREIGKHKPKEVVEQQALVADAEALVFVAPVFWMGFPAILKGWIERVFAYGFAYTLDPEGWQGTWTGGSRC